CAEANGPRGVHVKDGKAAWKVDATYLAMTEERVVVEGAGEAVIVDAESGGELSRVRLPATVMPDAILATCGDVGRELFVQGQDGKLARIADVKGRPAIAWSTPVGRIDEIEACAGATVMVRASAGSAVVLDRDGVRAFVPFAAMGAALGDTAYVSASWSGPSDTAVRRGGLPVRYRRQLRLPVAKSGVALPAELRDLPEAQ